MPLACPGRVRVDPRLARLCCRARPWAESRRSGRGTPASYAVSIERCEVALCDAVVAVLSETTRDCTRIAKRGHTGPTHPGRSITLCDTAGCRGRSRSGARFDLRMRGARRASAG